MIKNFLKLSMSSGSVVTKKLHFSSASGSGKLNGKVAVVTASTDGIGLAIARRLAQDGARVVISSRKQANVARVVQQLTSEGLQASGVVCHVSKAEDRRRLFQEALDKYGGIDILVSNAAANPQAGPVLETSEDAWDKIFDVNVKAAFLLSQEVVPHIKARGGGSIVYISSIAGLQPFPLLGAYSVSKTALLGLTKAAAQELVGDNIRVNCLAPGIVETKFSSALTSSEAAREAALSTIPMGRFGTAPEMGAVVSFLCSEDASFITGEIITATGGMASRL